jgi:hypothetical protein
MTIHDYVQAAAVVYLLFIFTMMTPKDNIKSKLIFSLIPGLLGILGLIDLIIRYNVFA